MKCLSAESKSLYRSLCKKEKTIPVFCSDWWMDAVCGEKNWGVLIVEKNGEIVSALPIFLKSYHGLRYITNLPLTEKTGIWIKYLHDHKYCDRLEYEKDIMNEIITQLKQSRIYYFYQGFHYSITNWLPFYWNGFEQTTRYTYVIEDLSDMPKVFDNFSDKQKKDISEAERIIDVYEENNINKFYDIYKMNFEAQSRKIPYSIDLMKRLDNACSKHSCRKIFFAKGKEGLIYSAIYTIWDNQSTYFLTSGFDPKYKNIPSKTLLLWEAIKHASKVSDKFDFEGSMNKYQEALNRGFGAVQRPYFIIKKVYRNRLIFTIMKDILDYYRGFRQKISTRKE